MRNERAHRSGRNSESRSAKINCVEETMRKSLKSRLVATVAALSLATTPVLAQETTIAVFTKNHSNPFFQVLRLAADKAGAALGVKIVHYIPTKPDSIPEQL